MGEALPSGPLASIRMHSLSATRKVVV